MKRSLCLLFFSLAALPAFAAPLRVVVSADAVKFRDELVGMLRQRGVEAESVAGIEEASLQKADVFVLYSSELMKPVDAARRAALEAFARRGGGFVVLHGGIAAGEAAWWKPLIGGAWVEGGSRQISNRMMLCIATDQHPIVREASPFDLDDKTLFDLDVDERAQALGSAFTPKITGGRAGRAEVKGNGERANIYDIQPQMWAFEAPAVEGGRAHRAFVALQGAPATLDHTSFRAFVLRGIAWAAGEGNVDALCLKEELATLRYPAGGPRRAGDTVAQMQIEPGFEMSVVASEPLINKPIAVQWDGSGRLWVAETPEYPNGRRPLTAPAWKESSSLVPGVAERPARDRVSVLSEPNAAGEFTQKQLFYEGLELVTGFCLHRDGIIAIHQPDIVFVRDTDGDGKGETVERLFTGFSPGDTHFVANHLIEAPDGWIYVSMGGGAQVKSPDGRQDFGRVSSGIFRFKPDGSAIEQVSSKGGNGFGLDVTSEGDLFFGQATSGNPVQHVVLSEPLLSKGKVGTIGSAHSVIEGRKVVRPSMPDRAPLMQIDVVGGYSSACASLVYEGGAWPEEWSRSSFCSEPILNIVHREALKPTGPTFTGEMTRKDAEFIYSPDYWFRPFDVAPGPDGAIYLLDFYTPVVAHSDSRGPQHGRAGASVRPDRDHYFGRIYRVTHKQARRIEVPDLAKADPATLVKAFAHPNRTVRFNAHRLLMERGGADAVAALLPVAREEKFAPARILALWALQRLNGLKPETLSAALRDGDASVRKAAALVAEAGTGTAVQEALAAGLADADPQVRVAMLRGLASTQLDAGSAAAVIAAFPTLADDWSKSAAVAAASGSAATVIEAALSAANPDALRVLVSALATGLSERQDAASFARLIALLPSKPGAANGLKRLVLEAAATLKNAPAGTPEELAAIGSLLASEEDGVKIAALPLAATWDKTGVNKGAAEALAMALVAQLNDAKLPDARRGQIVESLVGARNVSSAIMPALARLLQGDASDALKRQVVVALGATGEPAAGGELVAAFVRLSTPVQNAAFDRLLTRPEWSNALLDAVEKGAVNLNILGPSNIFRLRTHPVKEIGARATALLDKLRKPNTDKEALLARLIPEIVKPGNGERGREVYNAACAVCHQFGDTGTAIGPVLTGMGAARGPAELLVHIVDPNRAVDAGYEVWDVETRDGKFQAGLVAQENEARLLLRGPGNDVEVLKENIKTRTNTHRSLMPEGFEALGAETLRDLLTYLCGGPSRFRVLDLSGAFTADTRRGLYESQDQVRDTVSFKKFGLVNVEGIPFDIASPEKSVLGGNVIVLKGGGNRSFANTLPMRVEVPVNLPATKLHFLGGIAGWGASKAMEGAGIMKVTMRFADKQSESVVLRNGVEFADYVAPVEVPGSKLAEGVVSERQIRWFTIPVRHGGILEGIVLESFNAGPAPTTVAITAELAEKQQ